MQVTSTLVAGPCSRGPGSLGNPLPGVGLRLEPVELTKTPHGYRLLVSTPFGFCGYIGEGSAEPAEPANSATPMK